MYRKYLKRTMDILLSFAALVALSPVLIITAIAIFLEDRGPFIFKQKRSGRDGIPFFLLKFRSMPVNTGDIPSSQAANLEITKVGSLIRRTNIDELPQLINILHGEMSIVGPRPALLSQKVLLVLRSKNGAAACLPGLTGMAQINSYKGMPETEKAEWDGCYAHNITFLGDIFIILKTFSYLLKPPPSY